MANVVKPNGFTPVRYKNGQPYTGAAERFYKDGSVAIGVGDPVIHVTNSSDPEGGRECTVSVAGNAITGIVVAIEPNRADLTKKYLATGDTGYLLVATDTDLLFEVSEGTGGTPLTIANVGEHIDMITQASPSTVTGRSVMAISNAALADDNTFRLEGLVNRPDNAVGDAARWLVSINLHTEAGVGTDVAANKGRI